MYSRNRIPAAASAGAGQHTKRCTCPALAGGPEGQMRVMVISPLDDLAALLEVLSRAGWTVYWSRSCADALAMLEENVVPVVVCERDPPDGSWQGLLAQISSLAEPPYLIVTSRLADERLWAEALDAGVYDVLAKPFEPAEVVRVLSVACRSWFRGRQWSRDGGELAKSA